MTQMTDDAPLCECGCGERVITRSRGIWSRWRQGHNLRPSHASKLSLPPPVIGMQLSLFPDVPELALPYGATGGHA